MNAENSLPLHNLARRIIFTALALIIWFWTQSLIGARSLPATGIGDAMHQWTAPLNSYFYENVRAANALLIVSSGLIDALGLFLLGSWLFGRTVRPFLGLLFLMIVRQIMQAFCALPTPPHMVWRYPGFPSLLVTYSVANDYFFSGHTAIAVFAATQLARFKRRWLTALAIGVVLFEAATVLVLRAHYTMDVFTGIVTALWVAAFCERIAPAVDNFVVGKK
jgi:hypothetical protein